MAAPKILAFAGSAREGSFNKRLVKIAAAGARAAGAAVTEVDLRDFPMPLFDLELEAREGMNPHARRFKELLIAHDGLLIASPEHNSSISALLKNTIDWVSRWEEGEQGMVAFEGKVATLMSASPGALGGLRGLRHVREILGNIGVVVLPAQIAIVRASDAFRDDGALKDEKQHGATEALGASLANTLAKLTRESVS